MNDNTITIFQNGIDFSEETTRALTEKLLPGGNGRTSADAGMRTP